MSWTRVARPYKAFEEAADGENGTHLATFLLDVWDSDNPNGTWDRDITDLDRLKSKPPLRIILAPLDLPKRSTKNAFVDFFGLVGLPSDFTLERVQSVSHSFGARSDSGGSYAWFHFLCKHIRLTTGPGNAVGIAYHEGADRAGMELPQADYSYLRSGFFLRTAADGGTTLVCFGATAGVRARIDEFVEAKTWQDVTFEPYILFDLVLEGLFKDVDQNCWNMNTVFGALEHQTLASGNSKKSMITKDMFIGLHNLAKHMTHLAEAIQSCSSVAEEILSRVKTAEPGPGYGLSRTGSGGSSSTLSPNEVHQQLRDCIQYRRSLFQSTKLRLASMQKRVENTINLSFNLVTQQDSVIMIQDSNSMKIIAVITILFLPTTAVASVVGSQLFTATDETGTWIVEATPLFAVMWYITAPLTVVVLILAALWIKYTHHEERENSKELLRRLMNISSKSQPSSSTV